MCKKKLLIITYFAIILHGLCFSEFNCFLKLNNSMIVRKVSKNTFLPLSCTVWKCINIHKMYKVNKVYTLMIIRKKNDVIDIFIGKYWDILTIIEIFLLFLYMICIRENDFWKWPPQPTLILPAVASPVPFLFMGMGASE